ncbi:MAG: VOC family protein [Bauldia sp.]
MNETTGRGPTQPNGGNQPTATDRTDTAPEGSRSAAKGFVHVDISADDPARAARFFEQAFGWRIQELPGPVPYWLLLPQGDGAVGVGGGIAKRELPQQTVMPTIEVPSAGEYAERIREAGGILVAPPTDMPGVGTMVVFKDTEGNVFGILEPAREGAAGPPTTGT